MAAVPVIRESLALADGFRAGPRLRCVSEPADGGARGTVLLLPPFAEEMNKSRRMCAQFARLLAADGWRVARIDLFGCGDSAGELRDADWSAWIEDLRTELARHDRSTGALWLWALRAGALFADELLAIRPDAHLLLWQPVLSGSLYLQQFQRLRSASRMLAGASTGGEEPPPAQAWARGDMVEIAGYEVPAGVARGLQSAQLSPEAPGSGRVVWFELSARAEAGAAPATRRAADAFGAAGRVVELQILPGAAFWQSTEIIENEDLLRASRAALRGEAAAGRSEERHAA